MKQANLTDYILLTLLSIIWASAFFNIKIATESFGPMTIAFLRVFFGSIPVLILCFYKKIVIEAFSKDWHWFMLIGLINLVIPFFLIAYGVKSVQSNLAAILMSTTPLSSTILGHFYTKNEKFNFAKTVGILIGFAGIVYLFSDNILIDKNLETPWENTPSLNSTMSVIYLGIVPTGVAWLLRFKILKKNGLIFQSQVSYLIPIFGIILGYIFLNELITYKVLISLLAVVVGIYFVRKADTKIII